jgi:hypothetical protein
VFNYTRKAHTVTEVSQSGYDACDGGNSVSNDDSGATTVTLTTPGVHYFICDVPGHCAGGMKLAVTAAVVGVTSARQREAPSQQGTPGDRPWFLRRGPSPLGLC